MRLFSEATIEQARQKIGSTSWAAEGWQAVQHRVAEWHRRPGQIPEEAGGWIHNYICPEHWLPLRYNGNLSDYHACPAGHVCAGKKYDAAWRVWRHRQIADLAREAALAYVVLGVESGRETAVSILAQYAGFYSRLDGQSDAETWMLTGHAFNQALTEALWAIPLIHTYDLVADTLDSTLQAQLTQDLWQPLANVMTRAQDKLIAQNRIESNYMAWLNVTIGCLGFALNDPALIERAVQPPAGFTAHLDKAIFADGLEYEGSPYYHNFVLLAYLILAEAAKVNNVNLYTVTGSQGQTLTGMGCAFAQLAWPDGSIPDLSDGSYWQDSIYDSEICQAFEILNAAQPRNKFAWILRAAYRRQNATQDNWAALLYGPGETTTTGSVATGHTILKKSGIAVLRTDKMLAALVPFGPYRGSHHQYDRLSLTVWPFSRDAGSPLYGLPARKAWYPHSYAHNTLVVDGQSHANCGGELLDWDGHCLTTSAPEAYPGVTFKRTTEMKENTILDKVAVQSNETHTFDWVFHLDGDIKSPLDSQPLSGPLANGGAGSYIKLHSQSHVNESVSFDINYRSNFYRLTLTGEQPFTLLLGKSPGTSRYPQQRRHVLIGRTVGTQQRYQTTIVQL
ncbi:MAG: hypothetical protein D6768_04690 [Chloroflexi bacterium]|nr:MAG: hypothetical protein D6768_04690 [Chloroflexota bacterium]